MKFEFLRYALVGIVFIFSNMANAVLITSADQVTIGDKVWAKVDLFSGLSWNVIHTQCPLTVCSATSSLNGYDMDGWIWASSADVAVMLTTFTAPITIDFALDTAYSKHESLWAPAIISTFGSNRSYSHGLIIQALPSDDNDIVTQRIVVNDHTKYRIGKRYDEITLIPALSRNVKSYSGFFYKVPVDVPEPSTFAILALGMIGLASRRFKKQF